MNQEAVSQFRFRFRALQQEFIAKDLDRNNTHDYWIDDIAGLHRYGLIDRAIAEADAHPVVPLVPKPVPWNGYLFKSLPPGDPPPAWREIPANRRLQFMLCAFPAEPGVTGDYIYVIIESGSPFRCHVKSRPVPTACPSEEELRRYWARDCGG